MLAPRPGPPAPRPEPGALALGASRLPPLAAEEGLDRGRTTFGRAARRSRSGPGTRVGKALDRTCGRCSDSRLNGTSTGMPRSAARSSRSLSHPRCAGSFQGAIAPSRIDFDGSGTIRSRSRSTTWPSPSQRGQAPRGLCVAEEVRLGLEMVGPALAAPPAADERASCRSPGSTGTAQPRPRPSRSSRAAARGSPCRGPGGRRSRRPCRVSFSGGASAEPVGRQVDQPAADASPGRGRLRAATGRGRPGRSRARISTGKAIS